MLRLSAGRLRAVASRWFTTSAARCDEAAAPAGMKEFTDLWMKKAPSTMAVPEFNAQFVSLPATGESLAEGELFPVNFYMPHSVICQAAKKDTVLVPGMNGVMGIKASHVPIVVQMKPGVVELHNGPEVEKYFVSGGFAIVHPNSVTDICVLEAATLDQFDPSAVKSALAAVSGDKAGDDYDAAVARASSELLGALDQALDAKS